MLELCLACLFLLTETPSISNGLEVSFVTYVNLVYINSFLILLPHEIDIRLLDAIDAFCVGPRVINIDAEPGAFSRSVALEDNLERKAEILL